MVAGNQLYRQSKGIDGRAKVPIGAATFVLSQIAGQIDKIGPPTALTIVLDDGCQRFPGSASAKRGFSIGEQVRIRELQNPNELLLLAYSATLPNTEFTS